MQITDHARDLGHGIIAVDTGFERPAFDAAYLLVDGGRAAFIDTGHNAAVPRLLAALAATGLDPGAVDWVIPTHVHLDHAGGAGLLMRHLPNARALIHPRGARHLIEPLALVEGARAVYGAEVVRQTYGTIEPIPAARVVESHDEMAVTVGGRRLRLIDTPGHARHHHALWDPASRGWFTGDTFGISYREFDGPAGAWLFPTTTPVQFEPDALRRSVRRMLETAPEVLYLTHFGPVRDVPRLASQFLGLLDRLEAEARALARGMPAGDGRRAALERCVTDAMLDAARQAGVAMEADPARRLLALDITLNTQGIDIWLSKVTR